MVSITGGFNALVKCFPSKSAVMTVGMTAGKACLGGACIVTGFQAARYAHKTFMLIAEIGINKFEYGKNAFYNRNNPIYDFQNYSFNDALQNIEKIRHCVGTIGQAQEQVKQKPGQHQGNSLEFFTGNAHTLGGYIVRIEQKQSLKDSMDDLNQLQTTVGEEKQKVLEKVKLPEEQDIVDFNKALEESDKGDIDTTQDALIPLELALAKKFYHTHLNSLFSSIIEAANTIKAIDAKTQHGALSGQDNTTLGTLKTFLNAIEHEKQEDMRAIKYALSQNVENTMKQKLKKQVYSTHHIVTWLQKTWKTGMQKIFSDYEGKTLVPTLKQMVFWGAVTSTLYLGLKGTSCLPKSLQDRVSLFPTFSPLATLSSVKGWVSTRLTSGGGNR